MQQATTENPAPYLDCKELFLITTRVRCGGEESQLREEGGECVLAIVLSDGAVLEVGDLGQYAVVHDRVSEMMRE